MAKSARGKRVLPTPPPMSRGATKRGRPSEYDLTEAPEWKRRLKEILDTKQISPRQASIGSGLNETTIGSYFRGKREPGLPNLERICEYLGISVDWLTTGIGDPFAGQAAKGMQDVPVISWRDIGNHIEGKGGEAMRMLKKQKVESADRRFVLDFAGSSMSPVINDKDEIDCIPGLRAQPDDIVVAWSRNLGEYVCRKLVPTEVKPDGSVVSARLVAHGASWSEINFEHSRGDRIVAVVVGVTRHLRRLQ